MDGREKRDRVWYFSVVQAIDGALNTPKVSVAEILVVITVTEVYWRMTSNKGPSRGEKPSAAHSFNGVSSCDSLSCTISNFGLVDKSPL